MVFFTSSDILIMERNRKKSMTERENYFLEKFNS